MAAMIADNISPIASVVMPGSWCPLAHFMHYLWQLTSPSALIPMSCSTNGTFINGQRVEGKTKIKAGDLISFGDEPVFVCHRNAMAHA